MLHNGALWDKLAWQKSISFPKVKVAWCFIDISSRLRVMFLCFNQTFILKEVLLSWSITSHLKMYLSNHPFLKNCIYSASFFHDCCKAVFWLVEVPEEQQYWWLDLPASRQLKNKNEFWNTGFIEKERKLWIKWISHKIWWDLNLV